MKKILFIIVIFFCVFTSCNKNKNCNLATINRTTGICVAWGLTIDQTTYPAESLPSDFEEEGLKVCVQYELIPSDIACTCCGTRARIISISRYDD